MTTDVAASEAFIAEHDPALFRAILRCRQEKLPKRTHGEGKRGKLTTEYQVWASLIQRCEKENHHLYYLCGARGIEVCSRWRWSYDAFLDDMGRRPSPQHIFKRRNNEENFTPDNCVWVTWKEHYRKRDSSRLLRFCGITACIAEWSERTGITYQTILSRLRMGWSVKKTLTAPVKYKRNHALHE